MTPERHQQIKQIFLEALEQPADQVAAFLEERCPGDPDLRQEVQILLGFNVRLPDDSPDGGAGNGGREPADRAADPTGKAGAHDGTRATSPELTPARSGERVRQRHPEKPVKRSSRSSLHIEHGRFLPGTVINDRYRIVALVGKGGMGEVYRADDLKLGQSVALKFLPPALAQNPRRLEQFMNEVRVARQVSHHNVCRVYDIGEHRDEQFISMEYVDGETLDSLISRIGRLPERKAVQLAQELCAALSAIHDAGILHRDMKPANIMIDGRGQLRLTDFGLASARELHGLEAAAGTPGFVAPEALAGREATVSSDIYTLGLLLYELFTGVPAYKPGTAREVLRAQESTDPDPPAAHAPDLSPEIDAAIMACLSRDPGARPKSARDVAAMLPGGDPLAAALAAGITPSPELVAASGSRGRIGFAAACAWTVAFIALFVTWKAIQNKVGLLSLAALTKPPDVLADRAESIIDRLGFTTPAVDRQYELDLYEEYIAELEHKDHTMSRWDRLSRSRPAPIDFWYRRSPVPISTYNPFGWISWQDPPHDTPGMISIRLTPNGLLRELIAVDPMLFWSVNPKDAIIATVKPSSAPVEPDWRPLFEAAGLDPGSFQRLADPERVPPVFADTRAAWIGAYPESPDEPLRIEAAGFRGRPVSFRTIEVNWPLAQNIGAIEVGSEHPKTRTVYEVLQTAVSLVAIAAAAVLARINLRLKRGDRAGGVRVAAGVFGIVLAATILSADTFAAFSKFYSPLTNAFAVSVALGLAFGVAYIAIEPYVRRVWPETIIAWTRLLSGQVLDPLVGQSVLVGAVLGVLALSLLGLRHLIVPWFGEAPPPPLFDFDYGIEPLGSTRQAVGMVIQMAAMSLHVAVMFTLILVILKMVTKRTSIAVAVGSALFGAIWSLKFNTTPWSSPATWVICSFGALLCAAVLMRYGVIALFVGVYVYYLLKIFPYQPWGDAVVGGAGAEPWYANTALAATAIAGAIVLAGAAVALFGSSRARVFGTVGFPSRSPL